MQYVECQQAAINIPNQKVTNVYLLFAHHRFASRLATRELTEVESSNLMHKLPISSVTYNINIIVSYKAHACRVPQMAVFYPQSKT